MTLLAGFSSGDSHFLIADAAITTSTPQRGPRKTSFGEKHRNNGRGFVREAGVKIFRLSSGAVGGYCGSVDAGQQTLRVVRNSILSNRSIVEALQGAQSCISGAEIIVVGPDAHGAIRRWHVTDGHIHEEYEMWSARILGSAPPDLQLFARRCLTAFEAIPQVAGYPQHFLTASIVALQASGQRLDLLSAGIGGTFWGFGVTASGEVLCQQDIMYVLFERDATDPSGIRLSTLSVVVSGQREDIAFSLRLRRSAARDLKVFVGDVSYVSDMQIRTAARTMTDGQPLYLAFVQRDIGSVLVCSRRAGDDESLFAVEYRGGAVELRLDRVVVERLRSFAPQDTMPRPTDVPYCFLHSNT